MKRSTAIVLSALVLTLVSLPATASAQGAAAPTDTLQIDAGGGANQSATVSYNTPVVVTITAIDLSTKKQDAAFNKQVTVTSSDKAVLPHPVQITGGVGYDSLTFLTAGAIILTVTGPSGDPAPETIKVQVATTVGGCSSCFATIGAGAVVNGQIGDYNDTNNILQTTHLGSSTPQYLVGVAYKLPIRGLGFWIPPLKSDLKCTNSSYSSPSSDAEAAYCFPFKAFISLKFTPDASQTFNGFTYGLSHALHKDLDIMGGWSYSAYNDVTPGFRNAAVNIVQNSTTGSSTYPCYAQWPANLLSSGGRAAFDGFPTQLLTNTNTTGAGSPICTPGAQIYSGSPLSVHYGSGLFIGITVPISFKTLF